MPKNEQSESQGRQRSEFDPYRELCRGMTSGLLITVNCSDPSQTGIDEMKVVHVDKETGELQLEAHSGGNFILTHDDRRYGTAIKEVGETEFAPIHDPVVTIEVIGIAQ